MNRLPDFRPLKVAQSARPLSRQALDSLDHLAIVLPKHPSAELFRKLPQGKQLERLFKRAKTRGTEHVTSRFNTRRDAGVTLSTQTASTRFQQLTWSRKLVAECLRDNPGSLGVVVIGLDDNDRRSTLESIIAAAEAAAFELPTFKTTTESRPKRLKRLKLLSVQPRMDLKEIEAGALGNNVARWFTALPPNELDATSYRKLVQQLAREHGIRFTFIDERKLAELGANAFLAVSQGNAKRDAGIIHLRYRPGRQKGPDLALVGKGILFDTGGTNLKPFKGMLDMHMDMQGSAVALGTLLALATLDVPYAIDAWLPVTENRISGTAYKSQDVIRALNGTTIQVIHTDAEGRMVLADSLALAARENPGLILDYATLTGSCVAALTERYSGAFSNRKETAQLLVSAGNSSGERVWPFPMDDDYDEELRSEVADVKQCAAGGYGDHILAARFLSRFVPDRIPWIHLDLSAGQHKGGLGHVPSEVTGFGVRLTLELLQHTSDGPRNLARLLTS